MKYDLCEKRICMNYEMIWTNDIIIWIMIYNEWTRITRDDERPWTEKGKETCARAWRAQAERKDVQGAFWEGLTLVNTHARTL